jgi:hypothetical protein
MCFLTVFSAALSTLLPGCSSDPTRGYSFSSAHATQIRSVAVPIWNNDTFQKGIEYDLTDAIIKEIQRTTPWVVVSSTGGRADTTLTGTITDANLRSLSTSSQTGMVQEVAVDVTVDFEWRDSRTGEPLATRRGFQAMEPFVPVQGSQERIELGRHAVVQELARDIVAELRNKW